MLELVTLSYATFDETMHKVIAKDYFLRGLHPQMQLALEALPGVEGTDINKLASVTARLQLAGIPSFDYKQCMNINDSGRVDLIVAKVIHHIGELLAGSLAMIRNAETEQAHSSFDREVLVSWWGPRQDNVEIAWMEGIPMCELTTNHKGNADYVKALTNLFVNAQSVLAKLVGLEGMMLGTNFVQTYNDLMGPEKCL